MEKYNSENVVYNHKFDNGFECSVDKDGIIWYKTSSNAKFQRPCMKDCYHQVQYHDPCIAEYVLSLSCEIQDDKGITERASRYKVYKKGFKD